MKQAKPRLPKLPVPASAKVEFGLPALVDADGAVSRAAFYACQSLARNTIRSYNSAWRQVVARCERWNVCPLPMAPTVAADLIAGMADDWYEASTIRATLSVIAKAHRLAGLPSPTDVLLVRDVMRGISRLYGGSPSRQKLAVTADELRGMAAAAAKRPWPHGIQEWAVIALTFFCGLRREETVALDVEDLEFASDRLTIHLIKSKKDQYGRGAEVVIERLPDDPQLCPVAAVEAWLEVLGETSGPLFRRIYPGNQVQGRLSAWSVAEYVKRFAPAVGLSPADVGAHSLRAGCVTELKERGVDDVVIAAHVRHASLQSLQAYYRPRQRRVNIARALLS
ncbi:MAG TPA: tyrosine-type recombinase/integrase [Candidatus Eremiobacteraceae bacterium]|nr:tyrosine-type recombinase/integrase [Candidatus Eremiobacteraceae bacterium]